MSVDSKVWRNAKIVLENKKSIFPEHNINITENK